MFSELFMYGKKYDRDRIADLLEYKSWHSISRGVVTPASSDFIILFVTRTKQKQEVQYKDYIDNGVLYWEGENGHRSDLRIKNHIKNKDKIYLFYRDIHHTLFAYFGEVFVKSSLIKQDSPSQFTFNIAKLSQSNISILDDLNNHDSEYNNLQNTDKESIVKSRIGQGKFRNGLIEKWKKCSVSDVSDISLLKASHIKPWRDSSNFERLDPDNGLLLNPSLDHLFDSGLITFDIDGNISISSDVSENDLIELNVYLGMKIKRVNNQTRLYLDYHNKHVYKG
jgi:hypothetical protein